MFYYVLEDTVGEKNPKFTVGGQEDGAGQVSQFPGQFYNLQLFTNKQWST